MKCVICKIGETKPDESAIRLERGSTTLVLKNVPAEICANCGEPYLDEAVSRQALQTVREIARVGVEVDVREFVGAP